MIKNSILQFISGGVRNRNKKFVGRHNGESCYIFGNGVSLKYFDLSNFSDRVGISCNNLFFHKDFNELNVKYYFAGHPFFYYPYWTNPYTRKRVKNRLGPLYRKKMQIHPNVNYFVSLSNYFGLTGENIYYLHHFDKEFRNYSTCSLSGEFSAMSGALPAMLGMAIYMGFTDITLVGCDYSFYPQAIGHFFEAGTFGDSLRDEPTSKAFLSNAKRHATLRTVTPNDSYSGHILPHISYMELTGSEPIYRENTTILTKPDLLSLNQSGMDYKIFGGD